MCFRVLGTSSSGRSVDFFWFSVPLQKPGQSVHPKSIHLAEKLSCNNSEDLQRVQLLPSNTNQIRLLAWRTLLQWILPTLPPASLPSGFRGVAASAQPRQVSLVPPKQAVACHGVLWRGQKMVSASRQILEWRRSLLFQLSATMQKHLGCWEPPFLGVLEMGLIHYLLQESMRTPLSWSLLFRFCDLSQLGTLTISWPPLLICSPALL